MSVTDGQGFYEKYPRFFFLFGYKIQLWFEWKRERKEYVTNSSICSELDVTPVAALNWKFSSSEDQVDGFGDASDQ